MILKGDDDEEQRIQKLREMLLERPQGKRGYLSTWRARLMTESYKQTEGEPAIIRKAKGFEHVCGHIPLIHSRYQLLLGDPGTHMVGTEVEPEFMTSWLERTVFVEEVNKTMTELDALKVRGVEAWAISDEDVKILKEDIIPYWRGICHETLIQKQLDEGYLSRLRNGEKHEPSPEAIIRICLALANCNPNFKLHDFESLFNSVGRTLFPYKKSNPYY